MADFRLQDEGSILILTPQTDVAQEWLDDNVINESTQLWGRGIVVEHRFIHDLATEINREGMTIEAQ